MNETTQRIFTLIEQRGITAYRLAKDVGLNPTRLSDWKSGKGNPKPDAVAKIADYFGVSVDFLLGRTDVPEGFTTLAAHRASDALGPMTEDEIAAVNAFLAGYRAKKQAK